MNRESLTTLANEVLPSTTNPKYLNLSAEFQEGDAEIVVVAKFTEGHGTPQTFDCLMEALSRLKESLTAQEGQSWKILFSVGPMFLSNSCSSETTGSPENEESDTQTGPEQLA